ncbi:GNAT family N-acetyltransferase [Salinispira pacifica]|uniref:Putative hemolysin n=1 Tax=Salinispira pacifica TaxID=1307761 RepID=V5WK84_9SPIO|nr:GNAT family N-acetyltransferase [Salinispira pacifica]AHC15591.1 Putative hemolysin [Salinispira pacifica]
MHVQVSDRDDTGFAGELGSHSLLTRFRDLEIHHLHGTTSPNCMKEIGRIREQEFRREGGGSGKSEDIDSFDTGEHCYQLIAYDPQWREIVSCYRYIHHGMISPGLLKGSTPAGRLFRFSPRFMDGYSRGTVELGRSVVNRKARRRVMGLFAVWSGLGALINEIPGLKWFFGKLTVYPRVPQELRKRLFGFWSRYYPGDRSIICPVKEHAVDEDAEYFRDYPETISSDEAFQRFSREMTEAGHPVPPLMKSYLGVSREIESFGTAENGHFGSVFETAILLPVESILPSARGRFIDGYSSENDLLTQLYGNKEQLKT